MASIPTGQKPSRHPLHDAQLARLTYEGPDTVRKRGDAFHLRREVEAMDFVRNHTSIPVPLILDTRLNDENQEESWILMIRLPGHQLSQAWPTITNPTSRLLQPPKSKLNYIGSCSGGPAYDHRINNRSTCGPFPSVHDFHDFLVAPVRKCPAPDKFMSRHRPLFPDECSVVFAHADLSGENILVDPATGEVTGILDWEMAGFWPEWWEFRKAVYGDRSQVWWVGVLKGVIREYWVEAEADMDLEMF